MHAKIKLKINDKWNKHKINYNKKNNQENNNKKKIEIKQIKQILRYRKFLKEKTHFLE